MSMTIVASFNYRILICASFVFHVMHLVTFSLMTQSIAVHTASMELYLLPVGSTSLSAFSEDCQVVFNLCQPVT